VNTPCVTARVDVGNSRGEQLREVLVFLFLIAPSMGLSFFAIRQGSISFRLTAAATILRDLGLVSLIVFFLWRNRERLERIGWTFTNGWRDAVLGAVLFVPMYFGTGSLEQILKAAGFSAPATPTPRSLTAGSATEFLLAGVLVIVVAIAEEIIFRGYLILRLQAVTGSNLAAAILSSIIFSLGHGYEGTAGVMTIGFMGLFFALVYLLRRSLVAPIVMHFLQDFAGIVIIPLLKHQA
jgi:membrane protease YdiL (CAAX protease family)